LVGGDDIHITGLTITGGTGSYPGIAVGFNSAHDWTVYVTDCIITGNICSGSVHGAGIAAGFQGGGGTPPSYGRLILTGSTVSANSGAQSDVAIGTTKKSLIDTSYIGSLITSGPSASNLGKLKITNSTIGTIRKNYNVIVDLEELITFSNNTTWGNVGETRIKSGSTVTIPASNSYMSPLNSTDGLSVGVYSDTEELTWNVTGTATIICPAGTYSVSGSGTYFNGDGSTDLTATKLS
jgi:hypothetical protein